jgi:hypothetical protein
MRVRSYAANLELEKHSYMFSRTFLHAAGSLALAGALGTVSGNLTQ